MKKQGKRGLVVVLAVVFAMGGCALFHRYNRTEAQDHLLTARRHLDIVTHMELADAYEVDFGIAQSAFDQAKAHLADRRSTAAYKAAQKSIDAAQRILNDFYLNHIALLAKGLKEELRRETSGDPDNPLKAQIPKVERVIQTAQTGEAVSLNTILEDLETIMQITYSIRTTMNRILESDVSFDKGQYRLSEKGMAAIDGILETVAKDKSDYLDRFPTKTITTQVKVVGYTDSLNFGKGTPLMAALTEDVEERIPRNDPERRRFLNRRLSEFRARNIAGYIASALKKEGETERFQVQTESVGRGEAIPPDLPPPYPVMDARRRICRIYIYTTTTD